MTELTDVGHSVGFSFWRYNSFSPDLTFLNFPFSAVSGLSCGAQAPGNMGSVVAALKVSCPTACGIFVPRAGTEPMPSALEGGFLTTGLFGKSQLDFLNYPFDDCFPSTFHTSALFFSLRS